MIIFADRFFFFFGVLGEGEDEDEGDDDDGDDVGEDDDTDGDDDDDDGTDADDDDNAPPEPGEVTSDAFATTEGFCASDSSKSGAAAAVELFNTSSSSDDTRDFAFARSCARSIEEAAEVAMEGEDAGTVKPWRCLSSRSIFSIWLSNGSSKS